MRVEYTLAFSHRVPYLKHFNYPFDIDKRFFIVGCVLPNTHQTVAPPAKLSKAESMLLPNGAASAWRVIFAASMSKTGVNSR